MYCDAFLLSFVLLGSVLQCCLHDVHDAEFSRISALGAKGFFFVFLIPDGLRRGLFALKCSGNDVWFGIVALSGNV